MNFYCLQESLFLSIENAASKTANKQLEKKLEAKLQTDLLHQKVKGTLVKRKYSLKYICHLQLSNRLQKSDILSNSMTLLNIFHIKIESQKIKSVLNLLKFASFCYKDDFSYT